MRPRWCDCATRRRGGRLLQNKRQHAFPTWFLVLVLPSTIPLHPLHPTPTPPPLPVSDDEVVEQKKSVVLSEQQVAAFYLITDESLFGRCSHPCWPLMDSVSWRVCKKNDKSKRPTPLVSRPCLFDAVFCQRDFCRNFFLWNFNTNVSAGYSSSAAAAGSVISPTSNPKRKLV